MRTYCLLVQNRFSFLNLLRLGFCNDAVRLVDMFSVRVTASANLCLAMHRMTIVWLYLAAQRACTHVTQEEL